MLASLHLRLDPLHGATSDTVCGGYLQDALVAFRQGTLNAGLGLGVDLRTAERRTVGTGALQASVDAADDHGTLELGENAKHLKHRFTGGRGRIDRLLMQVQINASGVDFAQESDQVLQGSSKPINGPCSDHIELAPRCALQHPVKCGALVAILRARNAVIAVFLCDVPAMTLGRRQKLAALVLNALSVSGNTQIDRNALGSSHNALRCVTATKIVLAHAVINCLRHSLSNEIVSVDFIGFSDGAFRGGFCIGRFDCDAHHVGVRIMRRAHSHNADASYVTDTTVSTHRRASVVLRLRPAIALAPHRVVRGDPPLSQLHNQVMRSGDFVRSHKDPGARPPASAVPSFILKFPIAPQPGGIFDPDPNCQS
jgi:hypothetical protein